ncbi:MSHA biogenesis protein MshN [Colwellia chukchiensis]|uniref:MSHA biogenesis protein MshN n=1 Tax=Colwellia chukchiensis TaxID=641665 RepID=A0A1H7LAU5_9GAMM|nr:tetratricopeptide repeat protein [Colwellia chukchiensis]SEK96069.1 MSHA biogenesis protein MshN [Colwellia chukchiensis]
MSVINQMLKDLDKRQHEQQSNEQNTLVAPVKRSTASGWVMVVIVIVLLSLVAVYTWQLYRENQQLKAKTLAPSMVAAEIAQTPANKVQPTETSSLSPQALNSKASAVEKQVAVKTPELANDTANTARTNKQITETESDDVESPVTREGERKIATQPASQSLAKTQTVTPRINDPEQAPATAKPAPEAKLTISRKQLSPQALAKRKVTAAEQAIESNELSRAESLFEEVLLLTPAHEGARKQLAALWYGKKRYQDAVNLLSQGIALAPPAEEMRFMAARIYYERGQPRQAYTLLTAVQSSSRAELQALLANIAADLNEHQQAITAYGKLTNLQPSQGRWWLGMAVSMDSLGQFASAKTAYQQAIALENLSASATQFARQRLVELGE